MLRAMSPILVGMSIYPKPHLSLPDPTEQRYPYLLRGVSIERCNQVWSCDITYIRLQRGFIAPFGGDGLVQPLCTGLRDIDHAGYQLLPGGAGPSVTGDNARDF